MSEYANAMPDVQGRDLCGGGLLPPMRLVDAARSLVNGERQAAYGKPEDHCDRVARVWSVFLDHPVSAHQVAVCLAGLKLVREAHKPDHDNRLDAVGYLEIADRIGEP